MSRLQRSGTGDGYPQSPIIFSRLAAVDKDIVYLATQPKNQESAVQFVGLCQFDEGQWRYEPFDIALGDMTLFRAPGAAHRVLYLLGKQGTALDAATKKREIIPSRDPNLLANHRLGSLLKIRQIGDHLYASGHGGQVYRREDNGRWRLLDPAFLDGPDRGVDLLRELDATSKTPADYEAYKIKGRANKSNTLWSLDGSGQADIYVSSEKSRIFHYDGSGFRQVPAEGGGHALLDVLVETPDKVWVCGRNGVLLFGNSRNGFKNLNAAAGGRQPNFNAMALFQNRIYLSSYADPSGLFVHDGVHLKRVQTGLQPEIDDLVAVDATDDALWVIGTHDLLRFDGMRWERIPFPGNR